MSNEGSDFAYIPAGRSAGHDTLSSSRSGAASPSIEYVRVGRGFVKVKRYENEATQGGKRPPSSPISPTSIQNLFTSAISGQSPKRKWFVVPLVKRRKTSTGGESPVAERGITPEARRDVTEIWVNRQTHETWAVASQNGSEVRSQQPASVQDESDGSSAFASTIRFALARPELSISPYSDESSSSIHTSSSFDFPASLQRASPLRNYFLQSDEDQDEDGRVLLEALGFAVPPGSATEQEDLAPNEVPPQINNLSDPLPGPDEPSLQVPRIMTPSRPLPAIPVSHPPQRQVLPTFQTTPTPPNDSQDAYQYVFGANPGTSAPQHRQSVAPPPPYASRYSTLLDRPDITSEDMAVLQQHLGGAQLPEVAPLEIGRRR
ncbi:hypothetical protein FRC12_017576 [Ceratobasidium sp. 428]|nr:hypothetical protein FRC12_017576 [Ceratobasidium sp. 428]